MLSRIVITQASDLNLPEATKLVLSLKIQFFTAFFIPFSFALTAFCIKASNLWFRAISCSRAEWIHTQSV